MGNAIEQGDMYAVFNNVFGTYVVKLESHENIGW
jgi:hypothetical protein